MRIVGFAVALAAIFLHFSSIVSSNANPVGFGVSDLKTNAIVEVGETLEFEVARLYNTGDLSLNVASTWVPDPGSSGILVETTPSQLLLASDESAEVCLRVTGLEPCNLSGYVDFFVRVDPPENLTGNPSVPGGRANASFRVVDKPPAAAAFPVVGFAVIVVTACAVGTVAWLYEKLGTKRLGKRTLVQQNLWELFETDSESM